MDRAEVSTSVQGAPTVPMNAIWRTIRGYILWSYERGTIQYDIMVTLILIFVFFSPYWINFKDKPVEHIPHRTEVVVAPDGHGGFVYDIEGAAVSGHDDAQVRAELLRIIEPISGEVSISKVDTVRDRAGRILQYKVWVQRE
ncbi:MAG TPA: hypothetical protein VFA68_06890 [Terriglobales bacterium]|nr:hypothetical protein [Terriglobales bacterium]